MLQLAGIDCRTDFFFDGIYEAWVVNHSGYDGCDHLIDFVLFNVQPERTFVSSLPFDALAEVVVTSFVILAVSLRDISRTDSVHSRGISECRKEYVRGRGHAPFHAALWYADAWSVQDSSRPRKRWLHVDRHRRETRIASQRAFRFEVPSFFSTLRRPKCEILTRRSNGCPEYL